MQATAKNYEIIQRRYEILHTLNLGCSFITLRGPYNNQAPRCDITWLTYLLWILTATFSKKKLHGFMLQIIYTTVFRAKR